MSRLLLPLPNKLLANRVYDKVTAGSEDIVIVVEITT